MTSARKHLWLSFVSSLLTVAVSCGSPPSAGNCPCVSPPKPLPPSSISIAGPQCPSVARPANPPPRMTCGGQALLEANMLARGLGDLHPDLLNVRAGLSACADRTPTAEECAESRARAAELAKYYGPMHPRMIGAEAERAYCAKFGR